MQPQTEHLSHATSQFSLGHIFRGLARWPAQDGRLGLGNLHYGKRMNAAAIAALPQGRNGVNAIIPVARIVDMLQSPGQQHDYNGQRLTYPDIRLAYWAGGNPFHPQRQDPDFVAGHCRIRLCRLPGPPSLTTMTEAPNEHHPLFLVANQPASRLHSQLDFGAHSVSQKKHEREVCTINPVDAASRQTGDGDLVRLFNTRSACLAAATVSDSVMPGVVQLATGAWYVPVHDQQDPNAPPSCGHGNPNVLTRDIGTCSLAQGCSGQLTAIQIERYGHPRTRARIRPADESPDPMSSP